MQNFIMKSNKDLIKAVEKQIKKTLEAISELINSDQGLKTKVDKLLTIKGAGLISIVTIIAEILGFEQFQNQKQLVSFSGLDVVQRESGTSIKGKTRISKKGNKYIRRILYMPAMACTRHNQTLSLTYNNIINRKTSKMIGIVAIQRKLLVLIYTLWKKDEIFIDNYKEIVALEHAEATQDN